MAFKALKQPNDWTCWPTVMAMVTGKTVDEVVAFLGHDGGEETPDGLMVSGKRRRAIYDQEAFIYLMSNGWTLGSWFDGNPAQTGSVTKDWGCWSKQSAVLFVKSQRFEGCSHVVLWDGEKVLDPNPNHPEFMPLDGYEVTAWWPLIHWGKEYFDRLQYEPMEVRP